MASESFSCGKPLQLRDLPSDHQIIVTAGSIRQREARIARLEAALRPFAEEGVLIYLHFASHRRYAHHFTLGELRAAAEALRE